MLGDQARSTRCCSGAVPVPASVSVRGDPGALVTKDTDADAEPLACGVKVRVKVAVCPAAMVMGSVGPVI